MTKQQTALIDYVIITTYSTNYFYAADLFKLYDLFDAIGGK